MAWVDEQLIICVFTVLSLTVKTGQNTTNGSEFRQGNMLQNEYSCRITNITAPQTPTQ